MRRILVLWFLLGVPSLLLAQSRSKPSFVDAGIVQHNQNDGTLTANDPRPLMQAIATISQEYGWTVDFEDPPYRSHFDLVDDTDLYTLQRVAGKTNRAQVHFDARQICRS
jgi:hypothetical protein